MSEQHPPSISHEFGTKTKKYGELLGIAPDEVVADIYVFNSGQEEKDYEAQMRRNFQKMRELSQAKETGEVDPSFATPVFSSPTLDQELSFLELLSINTLHNIEVLDPSINTELTTEEQRVRAMPIKDRTQGLDVGKFHSSYATVLKFKPNSPYLRAKKG